MKTHRLILGFAPALALVACGGDDTGTIDMANTGERVASVPNEASPGQAVPMAMAGQQFADMVAASDAYEIEAGKLAQQRAKAGELKAFGKEMVEAHRESALKLKAAAAQATPAFTPAASMTAEQRSNLDTLRSVTGSAFDSAYKIQQVAAHEKALAALRAYAANGDVPALRTFASGAADTVSEYYDEIRGL